MTLCNLLRVPPIFIMDELFKSSFGLPELSDVIFTNSIFVNVNSSFTQNNIGESAQYYKAIFLSFVKIILSGLSKFGLNIFGKIYLQDNLELIILNFYFSVFCSSSCLFVLPARYLYLVYFHIVSVCVVLLSYWTNIQSLKVLSGKYENFKTDTIFEVITWDFDGIINLLTQLQVVDFVYILFRNIVLQCCLSLVFDFLQVFTTNHPVHKVSDKFN